MGIFDNNRQGRHGPLTREGWGFGARYEERFSPLRAAGYVFGTIFFYFVLGFGLQEYSKPRPPSRHDLHVQCMHEAINNPDVPMANSSEDPLRRIFGYGDPFSLWNLDGGNYSNFNIDAVTNEGTKVTVSHRVGMESVLVEKGFDLSGSIPLTPADQKGTYATAEKHIFKKCYLEAQEIVKSR